MTKSFHSNDSMDPFLLVRVVRMMLRRALASRNGACGTRARSKGLARERNRTGAALDHVIKRGAIGVETHAKPAHIKDPQRGRMVAGSQPRRSGGAVETPLPGLGIAPRARRHREPGRRAVFVVGKPHREK